MKEPQAVQTVWYNTVGQCPRCRKPLNASGTPTFSRLHILKCVGCGWSFDVESVRKSVLTQLTAVEDEEPEDLDKQEEPCQSTHMESSREPHLDDPQTDTQTDGNSDENFLF